MWGLFSRDPTKDFNYELGVKIPGLEDKSLWTLHSGKKKVLQPIIINFVDGFQVSVPVKPSNCQTHIDQVINNFDSSRIYTANVGVAG